jgi:hypothetical protein
LRLRFLFAMIAPDAVSEEMLKALEESDAATEMTVSLSPNGAVIPDLECAEDQPSLVALNDDSVPPAQGSPGTCLCTKCKLEKEIGNAVSCPSFICKQCNTKRSTLSQMFGHWPVDLFAALPTEQQIEFWRSECKGKVQVQNALVKEVTDQRVEETKKSTSGQFLPLSVYATMGYDIEKIKENCKDVEEHAVLGTTYKVDVKSITSDDIRKKVWADLFKQNGTQEAKQDKKEHKKEKRQRSSSSSSFCKRSSSSESSAPRLNMMQRRRAAVEQRKADAIAKKEELAAEKAKSIAAAKEVKEAEKLAVAQAKEKSKAKIASQGHYNALWNAHQGLVNAVDKVTADNFQTDPYLKATEKVEEGEGLIEECLDNMKMKISVQADPIKAYIQSLKSILSDTQKLGLKRQKK